MSTQLLEDLGLNDADPIEDQQKADAHGAVPDGKYHARLIEHSDEIVGDDYRVERMKFQLLAKPYAGKTVKFDLFKPHDGDDKEKQDNARQHGRFVYSRLGVLKSVDAGGGKKKYDFADPNKPSPRDYLGAEVVIEVKTESRTFKGRKGEDVNFRENKVANFGIYRLDDPKVKDVKRGDSSAAPPPPAKQPEVNLDGI